MDHVPFSIYCLMSFLLTEPRMQSSRNFSFVMCLIFWGNLQQTMMNEPIHSATNISPFDREWDFRVVLLSSSCNRWSGPLMHRQHFFLIPCKSLRPDDLPCSCSRIQRSPWNDEWCSRPFLLNLRGGNQRGQGGVVFCFVLV
uniref:Uncharacterized protein n=1 Tax=Molossus molossus TaxID=27622 RepID=A0A7J8DPN8_MOLMO|nr:hypothetical protein HJG59_009242 [Molossus molossus]